MPALYTVNIDIFAQYLFSHISRMVSDVRKYDVSENLDNYRLDRISYRLHENMSTRKYHIGLDEQKFSSAKYLHSQ